MSARVMGRGATFGAVAAAFLLAGGALPARAADQLVPGPFDGSGLAAIPEVTVEAPALTPGLGGGTSANVVSTAGLKQYAMTNRQLSNIRGGMELSNGITVSFGFAQITTVDGTVVEGLLVQNGQYSAQSGGNYTASPCNPCSGSVSASAGYIVLNGVVITGVKGQPTLSTDPGFTANESGSLKQGQSFTATVNGGANDGGTTITTTFANGIANSIENVANNQLINQASVMSINVSGLAQAIAAEQAVNSIVNSVSRSVRGP